MALNMHIKSAKFEQTKPESTDSGISYILQEGKKIHCTFQSEVDSILLNLHKNS